MAAVSVIVTMRHKCWLQSASGAGAQIVQNIDNSININIYPPSKDTPAIDLIAFESHHVVKDVLCPPFRLLHLSVLSPSLSAKATKCLAEDRRRQALAMERQRAEKDELRSTCSTGLVPSICGRLKRNEDTQVTARRTQTNANTRFWA